MQFVVRVGESASARTYSASRESSELSRRSDASAMLGEGRVLLLELDEACGRPAGDFGRACREGSEDLRRALGFSRFEKKPRKAEGIRREEEGGEEMGLLLESRGRRGRWPSRLENPNWRRKHAAAIPGRDPRSFAGDNPEKSKSAPRPRNNRGVSFSAAAQTPHSNLSMFPGPGPPRRKPQAHPTHATHATS